MIQPLASAIHLLANDVTSRPNSPEEIATVVGSQNWAIFVCLGSWLCENSVDAIGDAIFESPKSLS